MPGLVHSALTVLARVLRPGSRVRRIALQRMFQRGYAALTRRDPALWLFYYAEDVVLRQAPDMPGQSEEQHGHEAVARGIAEWEEAFSVGAFRPVEVLDAGDRLAVRLVMEVEGAGSGIPLQREMSQAQWLRGSRIARQANYWSWDEAVDAIGIDPS
jgi:ketosteroid isomerase-like protein